MNKIFYVIIRKCSLETYWYTDFVGCVFLVTNDFKNKDRYQLVDGLAWIDKKDAKKVSVDSVKLLEE